MWKDLYLKIKICNIIYNRSFIQFCFLSLDNNIYIQACEANTVGHIKLWNRKTTFKQSFYFVKKTNGFIRRSQITLLIKMLRYSAVHCTVDYLYQGYNIRKVISGVYASFVLQCTVSGPDMGSIFHIKNQ